MGQGHAAEEGKSGFADEVAKQESIYRTRDKEVPEGYVLDRSLAAYADILSFDFAASLGRLHSGERWLDIGAGKANALLDYQAAANGASAEAGKDAGSAAYPAQLVALSLEDRRTARWHRASQGPGGRQMQYLHGRRLREYTPVELGRFQIITDVFGGFSYTEDLSAFMERVLQLLVPGGRFYTVLQDVRSEKGTNPPFHSDAQYTTRIADADGADAKVCTWLKSIGCAEVACELRTQWKPPIEIYRISKTCDHIRVPPLQRVHYEAGTPPDRRYRLHRLSEAD